MKTNLDKFDCRCDVVKNNNNNTRENAYKNQTVQNRVHIFGDSSFSNNKQTNNKGTMIMVEMKRG